MKAREKYEGETQEKNCSLACRILLLGVATSIVFLMVSFSLLI
ncbi:MAG: hypothetical protein QNK24_11445 [Desulfuromusa sp.]|nr:hypothetical protein [Desulfuromusa sp.]